MPVPTPTVEPTPTPEPQYTSVSGVKIWQDNNDEAGLRPDSIVVRLLRNGTVIEEKTVTAASGWRYSFSNLLESDPVTGELYVYTVDERMLNNYYSRVDGYNIVNVLLPNPPEPRTPIDPDDPTTWLPNYPTPLGYPSEESLENLIFLLDYGTPLWGGLLGTGDETPMYPYIFSAIGAAALIALLVLNRKKKRQI